MLRPRGEAVPELWLVEERGGRSSLASCRSMTMFSNGPVEDVAELLPRCSAPRTGAGAFDENKALHNRVRFQPLDETS